MSASTQKLIRGAQLGAVALSVLLSMLVGFMAQASTPDYRGLFLSLLPFAAVNATLIVFVCVSREKARIWIVTVPAILGFASYVEMACRVWFGFRLI
jgi:hypothetical protein